MSYSRNRRTVLRSGAALLVLITANALVPAGFSQDLDLIDKVETIPSHSKVETPQKSTSPEFLPRLSAKEEAIVKALQNNTEVAFRDNDLTSALEHLKEMHEIEIWIDASRLDIDNLNVTLEISDVPLRSCLNLMLEPLDLAYFIEDDVLKVTSQEIAATKRITRTYPAGDLFSSSEEVTELTNLLETGLGLQQTLGIPSPLSVSMKSRVIVLRHSHQVHDQLLQLLRTLRETNTNERITKLTRANELVIEIGHRQVFSGANQHKELVVSCNEKLSGIDEFTLEKQGWQERAAVIRAYPEVPAAAMRQLMDKCKAAGFKNVVVKAVEE